MHHVPRYLDLPALVRRVEELEQRNAETECRVKVLQHQLYCKKTTVEEALPDVLLDSSPPSSQSSNVRMYSHFPEPATKSAQVRLAHDFLQAAVTSQPVQPPHLHAVKPPSQPPRQPALPPHLSTLQPQSQPQSQPPRQPALHPHLSTLQPPSQQMYQAPNRPPVHPLPPHLHAVNLPCHPPYPAPNHSPFRPCPPEPEHPFLTRPETVLAYPNAQHPHCQSYHALVHFPSHAFRAEHAGVRQQVRLAPVFAHTVHMC